MWPLWLWLPGWFLTALIVTGNGFVIYLIASKPSLRTKTNWFVLSLAIADFGFGATFFPLATACDINVKCAGGIPRSATAIFFVYASIANLCTLTLDRWMAVKRPLKYLTYMTKKKIGFLITVAWCVIPFSSFLVPYLTWKLSTSGRTGQVFSQCFWSILVVFKIMAFGTLFTATLQIVLAARKHRRKNSTLVQQLSFNYRMNPDLGACLKKTHEAATTKFVVTVVTVFLIFSSADIYHNSCQVFELCADSSTRSYVINLLSLFNSAINPPAYALFRRDFKKELRRMTMPLRKARGPFVNHQS